jgi:hypothetical protein
MRTQVSEVNSKKKILCGTYADARLGTSLKLVSRRQQPAEPSRAKNKSVCDRCADPRFVTILTILRYYTPITIGTLVAS